MAKEINTIAVLTSGGDAPGMNAVVRAVVRQALAKGKKVKGIQRGYAGLLNEEIHDMTASSVSDTISRGGTKIQTARCKEMMTSEGQQKAADICRKHGIDALVVIGGDGSFQGGQKLSALGINTVCVPGTIDLDIACTDYTVGFDTACNTAMEAINRACQLVEELGAGEVVGGVVDVYPNPVEDVTIPFEPDKYNKLLGTDISREQMLKYFERLDIGYDEETNLLAIPSFRQDLRCSADIAEEVARFFGYDNIPTTLPKGESTIGKISEEARVEEIARTVVEQNGFCGGMCYSFESPKVFDKLLLPEDDELRKAIVISNPLGEDYSIMRTIELNGILTSLAGNYNHRNKNVRLYEIGNVYLPKALPLTELPEERKKLTLGMFGEGDFFVLKGVLEELFLKLGLGGKVQYEPSQEKPFLHPGRQALVYVGGTYAGFLGQVHPEVCENYDMKCEAYVAGIDLPVIAEKATFERKYKGVAKYPAVNRDLSLVMKKDIFVGQLEKVMKEKGGKLLESIQLFDVYEGSQIEEGYKSVAFSLVFRSPERSLETAEVNKIVDKILAELEKMGVKIRA